jgi:murein DD-endopeptidase MepM/ murein hydrolase activator NlpD
VILDLGGGEYALLGHLRRGSVRGKHGDRVDAGAEIGRCGNSGNTTEPHLHFHLQDSPHLGDGHGLPAFFVDYVAHGKAVKRGEPTRGQIVAPARQATAGTRAAQ